MYLVLLNGIYHLLPSVPVLIFSMFGRQNSWSYLIVDLPHIISLPTTFLSKYHLSQEHSYIHSSEI